MKLIFLHGPPASGKLTIAKEIESQIGYSVFHNHLTIDTARPFFEFGTENFWYLVREIRLTCFRIAAKHIEKNVIYTSCYSHSDDLGFFEQIEQIFNQSGGEVLPIYLRCEIEELERRVADSSRVEQGKIRTGESLHKNLSKWNCIAVPKDNCLTLITDNKTPSQCAREIIDLLGLRR
jgi:adenylylsulfate kinase-like enzyme